ncbi:ATP-binding protein [Streptomyces brasiliscabiei]|uniref:ATP-binding protein n=1 Tax=Streptomyces brasiliscabiei TaxID=2736302 RepID=A0ABU8GSU9_9ACTN
MTSLTSPVQTAAIGRPTYSQTLPCAPETARVGRTIVRDVLAIWTLDHLTDRAVLIVTELIANAIAHTRCHEVRLIVGWPSATRVRVGVVDREPSRRPALGRADGDDESGRGLLLIDAVADRWGYDLHGSGMRPRTKEVWAELVVRADE